MANKFDKQMVIRLESELEDAINAAHLDNVKKTGIVSNRSEFVRELIKLAIAKELHK
jgi:Arc/MetJ-type ribon-helix-helix transcriptional regulator